MNGRGTCYHSGMYAAGLMSGTSCDGMAGALVRLRGRKPGVRLLGWTLLPYPRRDRDLLLELASGRPADVAAVARTGRLIADWSVRATVKLARKAGVPVRRLAFLGVHGQTLFHGPGLTYQAGDLSRIAERTGVTVVGDFRTRDVAAGGQGAPLAPFGHWVLFSHPSEGRLIVNLGGIANVTWLPAGARAGEVRAFDTGPANMILDALAEKHSRGRLRCDAGGRLAARGIVRRNVLARLRRHRYFSRRPPKSTGREEFGGPILGAFRGLSGPDALATATAFTAESVADQIARWLPAGARAAAVYLGGGGAANPALVRALREAMAPRRVLPLAALGVPDQAVEPVCFALLAHARLRGRANVFRRVTGARRSVCAGVVAP